jgi:hypothetical protein
MKFRDVLIPDTGEQFAVPQGIQRIDHLSTHGWQLRYSGATKFFSDNEFGGSSEALSKATSELLKRIARLPAPSGLQREPNANKTSTLPVGISGPMVRQRANGKSRYCVFSVAAPRFGQKPRRITVYIGAESTYTEARYQAALAKALVLREKAEKAYQRAATQAKRAESKVLEEFVASL